MHGVAHHSTSSSLSAQQEMAPTYEPSEPASVSDDLNDYDVISDHDPRSLESSIADLRLESPSVAPVVRPPRELPPSEEAKIMFETAAYSAEDVQAYIQRSVVGPGKGAVRRPERSRSRGPGEQREKTFRVYVDGIFDTFHVGIVLQLRQAKLSFPSVHLLVGPFTDVQMRAHEMCFAVPHVERCEVLRHIRWVDEVVFDAPVVLSEGFLSRHRIDYVAVEEGSSVDPAISKARLAGYDLVKSIGKAIPTRRTRNVIASALAMPRESAAPTPAMPASRKLEPAPLAPPSSIPLPPDDDTPEPREEFGE
ncbi:hypothetical protein A7U60_g4912 [Sanghuangporus baumii]|uniref:choline-phosphate cytidylyltransferase n=1 Tax=Sanghuangporus baumii TaxID=108892 RepID=A0A9Q5HXQ7_SANBA|nr:hypothetical protein A7U60_g4912 [Sanghuangporus baumii]